MEQKHRSKEWMRDDILRLIQKEIRTANDRWNGERYKEIEELQDRRLIDHQGDVVIDKEEKLKMWQGYITELFLMQDQISHNDQ